MLVPRCYNGITCNYICTSEGDTFFEGLLVNGWLSKVVNMSGFVESLLAKWVLDLSKWTITQRFKLI